MTRSLLIAIVFAACAGGYLGAQGDDQPLPATNLDLNAARVRQLEQLLAQRDAEAVGLRADVAVCQANTEQAKRDYQSLVLTNDVAKAVDRLKATMGGEWVWDNEARRVVPAKSSTSPAAPTKEGEK